MLPKTPWFGLGSNFKLNNLFKNKSQPLYEYGYIKLSQAKIVSN